MAGPISFGYQVLGFGSGKSITSATTTTAAPTTTKVTVRILDFDDFNDCACSLGSTEVWEDGIGSGGAGLDPSVNDVIGDGSQCAQVTALNATGSADSTTSDSFSDCEGCNINYLICDIFGGEGFCLLPHMLVKLIDGSLIKVIDLNLGDLIESPYGLTEVNQLMKDHPRDGYYIIEDELYISDDHPILINGEMIKARDYEGNKEYVRESTNTVYVGTFAPTFNVYCEKNVYVVDGQYRKK
tara:strand:- start:1695 stop:2417 length:723 start_codon:yes stop_codon:yes gene_type:complete